jgi:hypothetical protein
MSLSWSSSSSELPGRNIILLLGIRDLLQATDHPILANAALSVEQSYKNFYVVEGLSVVTKTRTISRVLKRSTTFRKLHSTIAQPLRVRKLRSAGCLPLSSL